MEEQEEVGEGEAEEQEVFAKFPTKSINRIAPEESALSPFFFFFFIENDTRQKH